MRTEQKTKDRSISGLEEVRPPLAEPKSIEAERQREVELLRIQSNLGIALARTSDLTETFNQLLEAICQIDGTDCGGVYLVDSATGTLDLMSHKGLPLPFVESASHYGADSPQARLVKAGKPVYGLLTEVSPVTDAVREREGLRAVAVIPVLYEGDVIASLNLASHTHDKIPVSARNALEAIASQIGGCIARAKTEEALQQSEEFNRTLLENLADRIFAKDTEGRYTLLNRVSYDFWGIPHGTALGKTDWEIHDEDTAKTFTTSDRAVFETGTPYSVEERVKAKDGRESVLSVVKVPLRDKAGLITGLVGISRDITDLKRKELELSRYRDHLEELVEERTTELQRANEQLQEEIAERKRAEEAFRETEEKLKESYGIINKSPAVVFLWKNEEGWPVEFASENAQEIFGYTAEEFTSGKVVYAEIVHPDDLERVAGEVARYSREIDRKEFTHEPYRIVAKDRRVKRVDDRTYIRRDGEGRITHYQGIVLDITERYHLEAQLQHAQKMEAVGTLAGGVAHDFNNLLQAVQGYADLLLLDKEEGDPGYRDLREIVRAAQRGSELTQQLLAFSRKIESKLRPVNLNMEVDKMRKMLERTTSKMIEIELRLAASLKIVNADPTQIEQILVNLVVNAKEAMPDGGKLLIQTENVVLDKDFCRTHAEARPGKYVLLRISDKGHGMDKETLEHIFDPFYTTKGLAEGTGLGLAMVYGIVKSHRGLIECSSELGKGTTFKIYLPIIEQEIESEKAIVTDMSKGGTETILLVDDEDFIRNVGERTLTRFGYTVLKASDGKSGLEFYRKEQEQIDLVILDLMMPGMSGRRCLEELLKVNPQAKVVIASGYSDIGPMKESIDAGARSFIGKPYQMRQLLKLVRDVLDERDV